MRIIKKHEKIIDDMYQTLKKLIDEGYGINIAFSAGKDSTATLLLFFEALKKMPERYKNIKFNIQHSNTLMEIPIYEVYSFKTLKNIEKYIKKEKLNGKINVVMPERKNKFFNIVLGNGNKLPDKGMRWCSERLKITPQEKFLKANQMEKNITIIGSRKEESSDRKNRLENTQNAFNSSLKEKDGKITLYAPIEELTVKDVWQIIFYYGKKQEWLDYKDLYKLYKTASVNKKNKYPEARFGCWVCPIVKKDKTMQEIVKVYPHYKKLLEFRDELIKYQNIWYDDEKKLRVRNVYQKKGGKHVLTYYTNNNDRVGMIVPGGYSLKFRKIMFKQLLNVLKETKKKDKDFPANVYLSKKDIVYIQKMWLLEGDIELKAFKIANEILKTNLSEKDLIDDYPKEYLIYKIIEELRGIFKKDEGLRNYYVGFENENTQRIEVQAIKKYIEKAVKPESIEKTLKLIKGDIKKDEDVMDIEIHAHIYLRLRNGLMEFLKKEGFYLGNEIKEEYIEYIWKKDKMGFWDFYSLWEMGMIEEPKEQSLFEKENIFLSKYEDYFKTAKIVKQYFKEGKDILDLPLEILSMEEKYRFLEGGRGGFPDNFVGEFLGETVSNKEKIIEKRKIKLT